MMEASSDCPLLSEDLIIEILLRLPVKSLLRCKSVCKNWFALIESPSFINKHFHHESNLTNLLVYWHGFRNADDHTHAFTLFLDETLERREELEHLKMPIVVTRFWGKIRGPCKGIFFLLNDYDEMALWNPATGRMRQLPKTPNYFPKHNEIGFGVDLLTDEFKIVVIDAGHEAESMRTHFSLYTSSNNSWRFVENETLFECQDCLVFVPKTYGTAFLNGFYYLRKLIISIDQFSVILAFDMHKEVFEEIEIPNIIGSRHYGDLAIYNNSLAIISYDGYSNIDRESIDIWVMKERGCWTKLLTAITPFKICGTLGFWKNHEIFIVDKELELIIWDVDSDDTRKLSVGKRGFHSGPEVCHSITRRASFRLREKDMTIKILTFILLHPNPFFLKNTDKQSL